MQGFGFDPAIMYICAYYFETPEGEVPFYRVSHDAEQAWRGFYDARITASVLSQTELRCTTPLWQYSSTDRARMVLMYNSIGAKVTLHPKSQSPTQPTP